MSLSAAPDLATTWVPLGVSLIALAGVIFTPVYSKHREGQTQRTEKLLQACEIFETACDTLQDDFANQIAALVRIGQQHPAADLYDYLDRRSPDLDMLADISWYNVTTALNRVERTARRIGHFDKDLFEKAQSIRRSLEEEVQVTKRGAHLGDESIRDRWEQVREQSDRLRHEFTMAVAAQT
ncbi:hypothetical protein ABZ572_37255 [Streptomyces sp. NPDC018338]|uniref:hypothetical protein n=1 Tax=Streptomyces sp. NPDC018338 TaxID=3157192 RepID=UPI0033DC942A